MGQRMIVLVAFVIITILTALAVLGAALGLFPGANERLITWGIPAVLGEIVASIILFFKTQMVLQDIKINLNFDGHDPVDFDSPKCSYTILDRRGNEVYQENIRPTLGHGGWFVHIKPPEVPNQSVLMSLTTNIGEVWFIPPHPIGEHEIKAIRV